MDENKDINDVGKINNSENWSLFSNEELEQSHASLHNDDDDEAPDFFDGTGPEPAENKKKPRLSPADPAYWDDEENPWEHLRPGRRTIFYLWAGGAVAAALLIFFILTLILGMNREEAVEYGYIGNVEKRGALFKTYEGDMRVVWHSDSLLPQDTLLKYSIANRALASHLTLLRDSGAFVRLQYRQYNVAMPWRGERKIMVTGVQPVDSAVVASQLNKSELKIPEYEKN